MTIEIGCANILPRVSPADHCSSDVAPGSRTVDGHRWWGGSGHCECCVVQVVNPDVNVPVNVLNWAAIKLESNAVYVGRCVRRPRQSDRRIKMAPTIFIRLVIRP